MRFFGLLLALCMAVPAIADPRIDGTFRGIIWSAGEDLPGTTRLVVSPRGTISGTYDYRDGSFPAKGRIDGCELADMVLSCNWIDDYGTGRLVMRFDADFRAFKGSWYDYSIPEPQTSPDDGYAWTGRKGN